MLQNKLQAATDCYATTIIIIIIIIIVIVILKMEKARCYRLLNPSTTWTTWWLT